jgi:hypothetical protein
VKLMGLFSKKSAGRQRPVGASVGSLQDPFAQRLSAKYAGLVTPGSQGTQRGVLRLVTGGAPVELTRPIAVGWNLGEGMTETYRGNPNFGSRDVADVEAEKTFEHFDQEVKRLHEEGWRLSGIDGRNLIFDHD